MGSREDLASEEVVIKVSLLGRSSSSEKVKIIGLYIYDLE